LLGLKIDDNLNCKKTNWTYYPQIKFSMLCQVHSHTAVESRYFKISLLCLFPFHHVIWICLLGKLNRQWKNI
jgi:hypothetical protein